jgi:hypothetical protein
MVGLSARRSCRGGPYVSGCCAGVLVPGVACHSARLSLLTLRLQAPPRALNGRAWRPAVLLQRSSRLRDLRERARARRCLSLRPLFAPPPPTPGTAAGSKRSGLAPGRLVASALSSPGAPLACSCQALPVTPPSRAAAVLERNRFAIPLFRLRRFPVREGDVFVFDSAKDENAPSLPGKAVFRVEGRGGGGAMHPS